LILSNDIYRREHGEPLPAALVGENRERTNTCVDRSIVSQGLAVLLVGVETKWGILEGIA